MIFTRAPDNKIYQSFRGDNLQYLSSKGQLENSRASEVYFRELCLATNVYIQG